MKIFQSAFDNNLFLFAVAAAAAAAASTTFVGAENHAGFGEECTHGKLYIMDNSTSLIHVVDTHKGVSNDMPIEQTIELPTEGAGQLTVYGPPADPLIVQYRGVEPDFDGFVRVIDTGFSFDNHGDHAHVSYARPPTVVENAMIDEDCHRPIHQVRHDNKVAIFCDGAFDAPQGQQNTTIFVIDETLLNLEGTAVTSAIIHKTTLEVRCNAIPDLDDCMLLADFFFLSNHQAIRFE
mmetsp:Transcript_1002/g.2165  ORF Transcript_1002/g.2165 Transcript_1002/m.2165 type:complete len:236 (+) Transcript_1002:535-1242(+)